MQVFVVTYQESYEDYQIVKIYSTYELAAAYVRQFTDYRQQYYNIEEFDVEKV
jgi:hypothetical protein